MSTASGSLPARPRSVRHRKVLRSKHQPEFHTQTIGIASCCAGTGSKSALPETTNNCTRAPQVGRLRTHTMPPPAFPPAPHEHQHVALGIPIQESISRQPGRARSAHSIIWARLIWNSSTMGQSASRICAVVMNGTSIAITTPGGPKCPQATAGGQPPRHRPGAPERRDVCTPPAPDDRPWPARMPASGSQTAHPEC